MNVQQLKKSKNFSRKILKDCYVLQMSKEESAIKYITSDTAKAKSILKDIDVAINHCSKTNQIILFYRYIECWPDWQVAQKVKYSATRYNELKIVALVEFAERLCVQENSIDLREIQKASS